MHLAKLNDDLAARHTSRLRKRVLVSYRLLTNCLHASTVAGLSTRSLLRIRPAGAGRDAPRIEMESEEAA